MLTKYRKHCAVLIAISYSHVVYASDVQGMAPMNSFNPLSLRYVVTLSLGPSWETAGKEQTLTLASGIEKTYTAKRPMNTGDNLALYFGVQKQLTEKSQGQIGIDVAATTDATLSGVIFDDANPAFDNYIYQYHVAHHHIMLKGKLLGDFGLPFSPWISAGLGIGFNQSYDFTNEPTISQAVASPNFSSSTNAAFTYAVGIGAQRDLTRHWQAGISYEYSDWGKSSLGSANGSTTHQSLSLSHLYTYSLMVNVTYLSV